MRDATKKSVRYYGGFGTGAYRFNHSGSGKVLQVVVPEAWA